MARQEIDLTTPQPNGKMGEPTKVAWGKVNDMTAEIYASPAMNGSLSSRNLLINCGLPINQRVFAGGALAAGAYGYDRWKAGPGGCNVSIGSSTGVFSHVSGALQQVVENPFPAWGKELTFSVENPSSTLNIVVGNASGVITAGGGRRGITITPTGSGDMVVQISASGATYSRPKLEIGSAATAFEFIDQATELSICQRYYEKSYNYNVSPGAATRSGCHASSAITTYLLSFPCIRFATTKIRPPSITLYNTQNGASGQLSENSGDGVHVANKPAAFESVSTGSFEVFVPNGTAGVGNIERVQWVAEAEI